VRPDALSNHCVSVCKLSKVLLVSVNMPEVNEVVTEEVFSRPARMDHRQFWQRTGAICLTIALSVGGAAHYIADRTESAIKQQGNKVNSSIKEPLDDVKADGRKARQYAERAAAKLEGLDEEDLDKLGELLASLEASGVLPSTESGDLSDDGDQPTAEQAEDN